MKKKWILCTFSMFLLFGATTTMAKGAHNGLRASAQLAISDVSGLDTGLAMVLTGIFPVPEVHPEFTVEGEFTTTISNPENSQTTPFGTISEELSYYTLAGYGVFNHPVTPTITLKGRVGLLYESLKAKVNYLGARSTSTDTNLKVSFGVGAVFDIQKQVDIIAEYTVIESDISHLSAGVQWNF